MKKIGAGNDRYNNALPSLEGVVESSELRTYANSSVPRLDIKLKGNDTKFWVRGYHRIDVGEKVRFIYNNRPDTFKPVLVYEILSKSGNVKYRGINPD